MALLGNNEADALAPPEPRREVLDGSLLRRARLFAWFGDAAPRLPRGCELLALDTAAAATAIEQGRSVSLIDDWISAERLAAARAQAELWEASWYDGARELLRADDILWPELDRTAMRWFWQDVAHAAELVRALRDRNIRELAFPFAHPARRPGLFYYPSDVCGALWLARCPELARPRRPDREPLLAALRRLVARLRRAPAPPLPEHRTRPEALAGRIVLACNPGEVFRFSPVLEALAPLGVGAVLLPCAAETLARAEARFAAPVVALPTVRGAPEDAERFGRAWQQLAPVWEPLRFHFEHYLRVRWPALRAALAAWTALWRQVRPAAVLVSSLDEAESQLPALAARRLGIPSLSIPHGATVSGAWRSWSDGALHGFELQGEARARRGLSSAGARGLLSRQEYPAAAAPCATEPLILGLTDPSSFVGCLAPALSLGAQRAALAALAAGVAPGHRVALKPHPGFPDHGMLLAAGPEVASLALPPGADLHACLAQAAVVVAVNYLGAGLVHALRAHKPVILLWNDPRLAEPERQSELFAEAGIVVRDPSRLWPAIGELLADPAPARARAAAFAARWLDDTAYPPLAERIRALLALPGGEAEGMR